MINRTQTMKDLAKVRRRKVWIRKKTTELDDNKNEIEVWSRWRMLWAERSTLWGREYYAARAVNEETTIEFVVRDAGFLNELNTVDYDVEADGIEYDIKLIDRLKDDGMWLKLKCLERGFRE